VVFDVHAPMIRALSWTVWNPSEPAGLKARTLRIFQFRRRGTG
jgi:hypothetical protein